MDEGYNGWTNHDTWSVALWIDNEEPNYRRCARMAVGVNPKDPDEVLDLAHEIRTEAEAGVLLIGDPVDLDRVNWEEIAQGYADDYGWTPDDEGEV